MFFLFFSLVYFLNKIIRCYISFLYQIYSNFKFLLISDGSIWKFRATPGEKMRYWYHPCDLHWLGKSMLGPSYRHSNRSHCYSLSTNTRTMGHDLSKASQWIKKLFSVALSVLFCLVPFNMYLWPTLKARIPWSSGTQLWWGVFPFLPLFIKTPCEHFQFLFCNAQLLLTNVERHLAKIEWLGWNDLINLKSQGTHFRGKLILRHLIFCFFSPSTFLSVFKRSRQSSTLF